MSIQHELLEIGDYLPSGFLQAVYTELDYENGTLLAATEFSLATETERAHWLDKGDWLTTAKLVGAEKVFFVNSDPVIVFCEAPDNDPQTLLDIFRQAWCMGRPQCLFIASPGELNCYSLNQTPVQTTDEWQTIRSLDVIQKVADVSEKLQSYCRDRVESGQLFVEKEFGTLDQRADRQLIIDLKVVRQTLLSLDKTVEMRYVHALIGRSIFVRYLEDRGILTPEYFQQVAENKHHPQWDESWATILNEPLENDLTLNVSATQRRYVRVLRNKSFTYALFNQLAEHFNGDMFPQDILEEQQITQKHLDLLRGFLLGDPKQEKLFLWAYDFKIIPIELISNIYEEFYHSSAEKDSGTHYTPSVLVEYLLADLLPSTRLATKPKILDFSCGSAIFLVLAFQRIVRYQENQLERQLTADELREILRTQITGIEINEEAVHVAAFSLYLAFLHYQEPKSILVQIENSREKPLPYLIYRGIDDREHYPILFHANSFSLMESEREYLKQKLEAEKRFPNRNKAKKLYALTEMLPLTPHSFDVVIGNPPWGQPNGTVELRKAQENALLWCEVFDWPIGDNELSQAFIARALAFLKPQGGACGLLVLATGLFFNQKSYEFRRKWLTNTTIKKVVNFTHIRKLFFSKATAPFCFVHFLSDLPRPNHRIRYWSAKRTQEVDKIPSVVLTLSDLHQDRQIDFLNNEFLWKNYWLGNHRDAALIKSLNINDNLGDCVRNSDLPTGQGFRGVYRNSKSSPFLFKAKFLPTQQFIRYGLIQDDLLMNSPTLVSRFGNDSIYEGWRLLCKEGIDEANNGNGKIVSRLENKRYVVNHSIHGINLDKLEEWKRKIIIGILWSSVARYYFFMTIGSWGSWHHKISLKDLKNLPITFPVDLTLREQIIRIVDDLRSSNSYDIFQSQIEAQTKEAALEAELDESIFELFDLNEPERDLILDMCEVGLEFFYRAEKSNAVKRVDISHSLNGVMAKLPANRKEERGLEGYLYAFLDIWNRELVPVNGEFSWRIIRHPHSTMLAVVLTSRYQTEPSFNEIIEQNADQSDWNELLKRLDHSLRTPVSPKIYIDGLVRAITEREIVIIKRDERRLWTRSMAREDAEAILLQAIFAQEAKQE